MDFKFKALSAVKWTTFSSVSVNILQFAEFVILTRLLDKTSFGLLTLSSVVIGFSEAYLDMGISNSIIQRNDITKNQLSSLYWLNVFSGVFIFILVFMLSDLIASFFSSTELSPLIKTTSITFLIQPWAQQYLVLWKKELRFEELSRIEIINKFVHIAISISMALLGYGVYSIVFANLLCSVLMVIQIILKSYKNYRPQFYFKFSEIKSFLSFGLFQMGEKTVNYFNYQIDNMLIGKILGVESLGIYSVAKQLVMKPALVINPIITKVTFPLMAKISHDDSLLKRVYLRTIDYLSTINLPLYVFIFLFSVELTLALFGEKWTAAAPIIQILSLWAAIRSTGNPVGSLLLAKGKANIGFWWNLALLCYVPLAVFFGSIWGLLAIGYTLFILQLVGIFTTWFFLVRTTCKAGLVEYLQPLITNALLSGIAITLSYVLTLSIAIPLYRLIVTALIGSVAYVFTLLIFKKKFIKDLLLMFKKTSIEC